MKTRKLPSDDPEQFYKENERTRELLLSWIKSNLIQGGNKSRGSYELKEMFSYATSIYIPNGTMKAALKISGFKPKDESSHNWSFKIQKDSPGITKFYK